MPKDPVKIAHAYGTAIRGDQLGGSTLDSQQTVPELGQDEQDQNFAVRATFRNGQGNL